MTPDYALPSDGIVLIMWWIMTGVVVFMVSYVRWCRGLAYRVHAVDVVALGMLCLTIYLTYLYIRG